MRWKRPKPPKLCRFKGEFKAIKPEKSVKSFKEGYITFKGYRTYYKIFGSASKDHYPLVVLHGGPGTAHNYLLDLADLVKTGRQVIFYDQLGVGLSEGGEKTGQWTIQLFIDELNALRDQLGLKDIHLLGHSWGGMLAIEYLLTKPAGVRSAILASPMISLPLYQREVERLKRDLPREVYRMMKRHEKAGTTDSAEYAEAYGEYRSRHLYRHGKLPDKLNNPNRAKGDAVYAEMWGASEAYANGTLKSWNRIKDLSKIKLPTLVTCGQYDELTPHQAAMAQSKIPNSQLAIITAGSHLAHAEYPREYVKTVAKFLAGVEKAEF